MSVAYKSLLFFHIGVGFVSLVLFWIPVMAKKGSAIHVRTGHWFAKAMYAVGFSALALSLMLMIDPLEFKFSDSNFSAEVSNRVINNANDIGLFLLSISILVLVGVRNGLQAARAKGNHALMRRLDNLVINTVLLVVGVWLGIAATGNSPMNVLFYIFSGLSVCTAIINLRFCLKSSATRSEQIVAHLTSIISAGIGSHTAFFVFGANRILAEFLTGYAIVIPWVLPSIIGTAIILSQAKRYRAAPLPQKKPPHNFKES